MCGIFGMVSTRGAPLRYPEVLRAMGERLKHRGPDGTGTMILPHTAIGVNRLRIIDLHPRADQPFTDDEHCVSLALNGEIYNAPALREQFPRYPFRSTSDAEVVLPLFIERGVAGLGELSGMFAIALWDEGSRRLVLARDPAGEKPLFYAVIGDEICFASEIQSLLEYPGVSHGLDDDALRDFLAFGYVREPRTMFTAIRKIEAGTALVFEERCAARSVRLAGSAGNLELPRITHRTPHTERELEALLEGAVRKQLVSDVPVGVFLSGGLDSSLITSIAARAMDSTPLKTFAVRFAEPSYDEGSAARAIATHLKTDHVEVMADDERLREAFNRVFAGVAEPIADPAILPTYLLAKRAREDIGVVLSGEGADELFGGYPTYLGHRLASWFRHSPSAVRRPLRAVLDLLPPSASAVSMQSMLGRFMDHADKPWLERHVAWFGTGLEERVGGWADGPVGTARPASSAYPPIRPSADLLNDIMRFDYATYLRDGLLPKIDRATMLVSLEARAPYLDRDVTAFAVSLPSSVKVRGLTTKWLLKRAARRWLPPTVIRRRKHGLSVPISGLLNGALSHEVDRLLAPGRLEQQGLLNAKVVGQLLLEHRAGKFSLGRGVWTLIVLQRWLEEWT